MAARAFPFYHTHPLLPYFVSFRVTPTTSNERSAGMPVFILSQGKENLRIADKTQERKHALDKITQGCRKKKAGPCTVGLKGKASPAAKL